MIALPQPGTLQRHETDERGVDLYFETGRVRISFPFEGTARVRFTPSDSFAPRRSWSVTPPEESLSPVPFTAEETKEGFALVAGPLVVSVTRDCRVSFADERGERFAADLAPPTWGEADIMDTVIREKDNDDWPAGRARTEVRLKKVMPAGEGYYGFGERIGLLDKRGRIVTNWTADPESGHGRGHDNMYQAHPIFMALRPGLAWGLFLNCTWYSRFDVGATRWEELEIVANGGDLDYFVFYGPTPAGVVEKLTRLTGRPFLPPPLWALGYHQSRWGYVHEDDMRDLAREFRERDIPIDAIHFDIDYMRGYRDFTWDPERFPNPARLLAELREQGIHPVTIIDPGVKKDLGSDYTVADEGTAQGMFVENPDGTPFVGYCWPDEALFPDFARKDVREWWGRQHAGHLETGVEGIWNDMNEPAIFDRPFSEGLSTQLPMPLDTPQGDEDERTTHSEVHNLYGLLMSKATHEGLLALRPDRRPWVLTRSGFTGVQQYAAAWMGDNSSWWEHLEASIPQLTGMGMSGVPHVGVDIGGFFGNASGELYARWVLMGTFYPFMRTHTAMGTNRHEPWSFGPEVEEVARQAVKLRYRLLPYIYTLAHEAHRTGAPILRPLLYDFPDDPATYHLHDQVMVGPHLMVAPIYHPGKEYRMVYLPEGAWYDYRSGEKFEGPKPLAVHAPPDRIPIFVRGGAVLPLGNERSSTSRPLIELTVEVYPAGDSEWTLIEDDGESLAYREGAVAETVVRVAEQGDRTMVRLEARAGGYEPHPRTLVLSVHTADRPELVTLAGEEQGGWTWDDTRRALTLRWQDDGQAHEVELRRQR